MFVIKWRRRMETTRCLTIEPVRTSLSRYATREAAQRQIDKFQKVFPFNTYAIE